MSANTDLPGAKLVVNMGGKVGATRRWMSKRLNRI